MLRLIPIEESGGVGIFKKSLVFANHIVLTDLLHYSIPKQAQSMWVLLLPSKSVPSLQQDFLCKKVM